MSSCPYNYISYMIRQVSVPMVVSENDSMTETVKVTSEFDQNINLVSVKFNRASLFYSPFTAGYSFLSLQSQTELKASLRMEPVPFSFVSPSAFVYDEMDLESEKLTSLIFMKSVSDLEPHEFIRSPVFRFYLDGYEYNHFILGPFNFIVNFNKIKNYPDPDMTEEEEQQIKEATDLRMNVTDPSNFYCLGSFNELTRTWDCISRNVVSISENKIEFTVMTTGVFAVLYCPKVETEVVQFCGFVCRNKKEIMTVLMVLVPILLIVGGFVLAIAKSSYSALEEKIKLVSSDENEKVFGSKSDKEETGDEGAGVEGAKFAYNNPLVFKDDPRGSEVQALENNKMKLKYKNEKLLAEKLRQLRKNLSLRYEMEAIQDNIARMKKMQGAGAFERPAQ